MKKIIFLLTATIVLSACGGKEPSVDELIAAGKLEALREKKTEISDQQKLIEANIRKLDSAIALQSGEEKLPLVNTITAAFQKFDHFLELQGDVETKQNVLVYPEMAGTLRRVYVKKGDRVRKGQTLATIDDGGMGSQVAQLENAGRIGKDHIRTQKTFVGPKDRL